MPPSPFPLKYNPPVHGNTSDLFGHSVHTSPGNDLAEKHPHQGRYRQAPQNKNPPTIATYHFHLRNLWSEPLCLEGENREDITRL